MFVVREGSVEGHIRGFNRVAGRKLELQRESLPCINCPFCPCEGHIPKLPVAPSLQLHLEGFSVVPSDVLVFFLQSPSGSAFHYMLSGCTRLFSLDQRLTQLGSRLAAGLSHGELYGLTEEFFSDPTVLTDDPRVVLSYQNTLVELQAKFGHHSKQLLTGVVQPLVLRTAALPDLQLRDALRLVRLGLQLPVLGEGKIVKEALRVVIRELQRMKEPLNQQTVVDLYSIQRQSRVVSYELVAALETLVLSSHSGLLSAAHTLALPQIYAYLGLSLDKLRPQLLHTIRDEAASYSEACFLALLKSLTTLEEFSPQLWQDTLFPRLQSMKTHHLSKELLADLGFVVLVLEVLAPGLKESSFMKSQTYEQLRSGALAAHRAYLEGAPKPSSQLLDEIAKSLRTATETFTQYYLTPKPYSLLVELFKEPTTVIKPLVSADMLYDSYQPLGTTRLYLRLLRKLGYQVIEVSWADWGQIPRKKAPGQLTRLLKMAQEKASRS